MSSRKWQPWIVGGSQVWNHSDEVGSLAACRGACGHHFIFLQRLYSQTAQNKADREGTAVGGQALCRDCVSADWKPGRSWLGGSHGKLEAPGILVSLGDLSGGDSVLVRCRLSEYKAAVSSC